MYMVVLDVKTCFQVSVSLQLARLSSQNIIFLVQKYAEHTFSVYS